MSAGWAFYMKNLLMAGLLLAAVPALGQQRLQVEASTGWRQENLRWSIAGNSAGQSPNVYSELKWKKVGGPAADVTLSWKVWRRLVVFAEGSCAFHLSGSVSDMDYGGNDRTNQLYGQTVDSRKGSNYTVAAGAGYRLCAGERFQLTPVVGYGGSGQFLPVGDPGGVLNSHYRAGWRGPLVRAEGAWQAFSHWAVLFQGTYHQVVYRADADWNLIRDFRHPVSFRHHANGYGLDGELGVSYTAGRHIRLVVKGNYFNWQTGKGTDELYLSSGETSRTQLNGVVMDGLGVRVGVEVGW
jgi:outer membrane protease